MEEEKEKQLAKLLGDYLDGADVDPGADAEILLAAETARVVMSAADTCPRLKQEFSGTLRARLVREAEKAHGVKVAPTALPAQPLHVRRRRRLRAAIAAAFFVFIVPTLWMVREQTDRNIAAQLEKYDKMYIPFTERMKSEPGYGYRESLFSENYNRKVRRMQFNSVRTEPGTYYRNYRRERRFPR